MSPLSDPGTVASGVSGSVSKSSWTLGGEFARNRWISGGAAEQGGFIAFDPSRRVHVGANVLERNYFGSGTLSTFHVRLALTSRSVFELEHGVGLSGDAAGASATLVRAAGDHGWIAFDAQHVRVDSTYIAGPRGTAQDLATITIRPLGWFRISARAEESTRDQGINFIINNNLGSSFKRIKNRSLTADLTRFLSGGVRSASEFGNLPIAGVIANGLERSAWARLALRAGPASASVSRELGTLDQKTGAAARPFSVSRVETNLRVGSFAGLAAFAERSTGQRRYLPTDRDMSSAPQRRVRVDACRFGGRSLRAISDSRRSVPSS